jgi:dienelactone hydrolase
MEGRSSDRSLGSFEAFEAFGSFASFGSFRVFARAALVLACCVITGCGEADSSSPTGPSPPLSSPPVSSAFVLQGDPESAQGATWTYRGSLDGVAFDLQGILLKPTGGGPFGAVVLSHGAGGNASAYSRNIAMEMRRWGLVCIATNYTHAGNVSIGAPGTANEPGASEANVQRGHAVREILRTLAYVDQSRVAAHGHSMGAFVTTALIGAYPNDFRVASHTAGGVRPPNVTGAAPSEAQARAIRTPYQLHHGDQDVVVSITLDQRLDGILQGNLVPREFHVYAGADHDDVAQGATVLARVRSWYAAHQVN